MRKRPLVGRHRRGGFRPLSKRNASRSTRVQIAACNQSPGSLMH